jgi:hypothetical protein
MYRTSILSIIAAEKACEQSLNRSLISFIVALTVGSPFVSSASLVIASRKDGREYEFS